MKQAIELVAGDRVVIGDMVVVAEEVINDDGYLVLKGNNLVVWLDERVTYRVI